MNKTEMMVNPSRRIMAAETVMSACLITGTEKVRSGYGNGDCILADFAHGIYAVADATERFSFSSRHFFQRLINTISNDRIPFDGPGFSQCLNDVYSSQEYRQKTTVSCVALGRNDAESMDVYVMSGGDSCVMIIDGNGRLIYRSIANMNFAGRSLAAGNVDEITGVHPGSRILLYTDGYLDFRKIYPELGDKEVPVDSFLMAQVDEIAGLLFDAMKIHSGTAEHDDIALLAIDPFAAVSSPLDCAAILGGTTPSEEKNFRRITPSNDRYLPVSEWMDNGELLNASGFIFSEFR